MSGNPKYKIGDEVFIKYTVDNIRIQKEGIIYGLKNSPLSFNTLFAKEKDIYPVLAANLGGNHDSK